MSDAIARGGNSDFHADAENPPDDLRTRIAAIVADHQLQYVDCYCGERFQAAQPWGDHVADAVIRELKKDYMLVPNPDETYQTPRTEWIAEDGSTWVT